MKIGFIQKRCRIGDTVSFKNNNGDAFFGEILEFDEDIIIIRNSEGDEEYISIESIDTFKKHGSTISVNSESSQSPQTVAPSPVQKVAGLEIHEASKDIKEVEITEQTISIEEKKTASKVEPVPKAPDNSSDIKLKNPKKRKFSSLDELGANVLSANGTETVKERNERENREFKKSYISEEDLVVREMGKIISCGAVYGFIHENVSNKRRYFLVSELLDIDPNRNLIGEYVVYTKSINYQGDTAICIHRPNTIKNLLSLADSLAKQGKKSTAREVISHIDSEFPQNTLTQKVIYHNQTSHRVQKRKVVSESVPLYSKANSYRDNGEFLKAIDLYQQSIVAKEKVDGSIKNKGSILIQLAKASVEPQRENYLVQAREFMKQYDYLLGENPNTWSYLENFYYAVKDYKAFKKAADKLLNSPEAANDGPRRVVLLNKYAVVLIKEDDYEGAHKYVSKALQIYPDSAMALKLMDVLNGASINQDEIDSIIASEIELYSGGLSTYIQSVLDEFTDYAAIPEKVKADGRFTKDHLKTVRDLIKQYSEKEYAGRAKDRANLLLTEGKLMQKLEPDRVFPLRSVMARYCNDMAKIHIFQKSSLDVVRFFYNESFALEEKYDSTAQQVSYCLLTNKVSDYEKLAKDILKNTSVSDALQEVIPSQLNMDVWNNILSMFLYNGSIAASLISKFWQSDNYKSLSMQALSGFGVSTANITTKEEYLNAWNRARSLRINEYLAATASVKSIIAATSIEEISKRINENLSSVCKDWMCREDKSRFASISDTIAPSLLKYCEASSYRERALYHGEVEHLISDALDRISKEPTKLSYETLLPLLKGVRSSINSDFENFKAQSTPDLHINLPLEETVVEDSIVTLQIELSLSKDSAPIHDVRLEIVSSDDINLISSDCKNSQSRLLEGGEKIIFSPVVKVSDRVLEQKAVAFDVMCSYSSNDEDVVVPASLSLHLYDTSDFSEIDNPFAPVAESGPLPADSKMFFGHQQYIFDVINVILKSPSKQAIIYGQKRSGKSSVLNKVESELKKAGAFCVKFSMGKIVRSLTEGSFFYKILSEIQTSLQMMEEDGELVPEFNLPLKRDFLAEDEENPVETFTKYMRAFKRSCKRTTGWEDRRLVVLIDEFTYMYGAIRMGVISPSIMQQWKAVIQDEHATFSAVLVGQDVVPAFKNEPYARNAFGVIEDLPLTYLLPEDARQLIETPILVNGKSRYVGSAVDYIMDYTACNPYYIQIFCSALVSYMNEHKQVKVTEADVENVAHDMVSGPHALDRAKFENLLSPRETDEEDDSAGTDNDNAILIYRDEDVEKVLRAVAMASRTKAYAYCNHISTDLPEEKEKGILGQLVDRSVLEKKDNYYKIRVRLYKEWLLNH